MEETHRGDEDTPGTGGVHMGPGALHGSRNTLKGERTIPWMEGMCRAGRSPQGWEHTEVGRSPQNSHVDRNKIWELFREGNSRQPESDSAHHYLTIAKYYLWVD